MPASISYPPSLSQTPRLGFRLAPRINYLETPADGGPGQRRPRSTLGFEDFSGEFLYDDTEHASLWTFYTGTAAADTYWGQRWFNFTHPVSGAAVEARFTAPPSYGGTRPAKGFVTLTLEFKVF